MAQENAITIAEVRAPSIPTLDAINAVSQLVQLAVKSGLSKTKNPADAFFIAMYGLELGVPVMTALRTMYSVGGGAPTASGELMLALIRRSGKVKVSISSNEETLKTGKATVHMKRLDSGDEFTATWGKEDDVRAGLKSNRDKYPAQMWTWRAVSIAGKALCSDIIGGLYTVEEIYPTAQLDENGAPIGELTISAPALPTGVSSHIADVDVATGEIVDEPPPGWATPDAVDAMLKYAYDKLKVKWEDIARYTGVAKADDYTTWNAKFPNRAAAGAAIKSGHESDMATQPPASPKGQATRAAAAGNLGKEGEHRIGKVDWSVEARASMTSFVSGWWNLIDSKPYDSTAALAELGKKDWAEFDSIQAAQNAWKEKAMAGDVPYPIVVTSIIYHPAGKPDTYSELTNGAITVGCFGLSSKLDDQKYVTAIKALTPNTATALASLNLDPIKAVLKRTKDGHINAELLEVLYTDIPF